MTIWAETWFLPEQKTKPEYTFYQSSIQFRFQLLILSSSVETKAFFSKKHAGNIYEIAITVPK